MVGPAGAFAQKPTVSPSIWMGKQLKDTKFFLTLIV